MTPAVAWSVDGRSVMCRGPIAAGSQLGGYLSVRAPGATARVAQVLSEEVVEGPGGRYAELTGRFLDTAVGALFDGAEVMPASEELVSGAVTGVSAPLDVGTLIGCSGTRRR